MARRSHFHGSLDPLFTFSLHYRLRFTLCAAAAANGTAHSAGVFVALCPPVLAMHAFVYFVNRCNVPHWLVHCCEFCRGVVALASGWVWSCRRSTQRPQMKRNGYFLRQSSNRTRSYPTQREYIKALGKDAPSRRRGPHDHAKNPPRAHTRANPRPPDTRPAMRRGMRTHRPDLRMASHVIAPRSSHTPHKNKTQPQLT